MLGLSNGWDVYKKYSHRKYKMHHFEENVLSKFCHMENIEIFI